MDGFKAIPNQVTPDRYLINKDGKIFDTVKNKPKKYIVRTRGIIKNNNATTYLAHLIRITFYPDALLIHPTVDNSPLYGYDVINKEDNTFKEMTSTMGRKDKVFVNKFGVVMTKNDFRCKPFKANNNKHHRVFNNGNYYEIEYQVLKLFSSETIIELPEKRTYGEERVSKTLKPVKTIVYEDVSKLIKIDERAYIKSNGKLYGKNGIEINTTDNSRIPMYNHKPVAVWMFLKFYNRNVPFRQIGYKDGNELNVDLNNLKEIKRYIYV